MTNQTAEHEPPAITRLRCRLLAPLVRAGKMAQSLVAVRRVTAHTLRARLTRLAEVSGTPMVAAAVSTAGHIDPPSESQPPIRKRRHDADSLSAASRGAGNRPTQSLDNEASLPDEAEDRSSPAAADFRRDNASLPSAGRRGGELSAELSREELAALERAARRAAEDVLRRMRHDQRALAEDVRACRAEPPAFQ